MTASILPPCTLIRYQMQAEPHEFVEVNVRFRLGLFGLPPFAHEVNGATEWTDVTRASLKSCLGVMLHSLPHEDRLALLQESLANAMDNAPVHKAITEPPF